MSQTKVQLIDLGSAIASSTPTNGLFVTAANTVAISTNSVERLKISTSEVVFNDAGNDIDFRVEGDTNANLLFVDASTDRVGIGNSNPRGTIHVGADLNNGATDGAAINLKQTSTTAATGIYLERSAERRGYYIYLGGDQDSLNFQRNNFGTKSDVMTLTRDGLVGIGVTSPGTALHLGNSSTLRINNPDGTRTLDLFDDANHAEIKATFDPIRINAFHSTGYVRFDTDNQERARIDASGRLLVGTSSAQGLGKIQVEGDADGAKLYLRRNITNSAMTTSGQVVLGSIDFGNTDGAVGARIQANNDTDSGWANNDYPTRLVFSTTADGASSPTERMRITQDGVVQSSNNTTNFRCINTGANGTALIYFQTNSAELGKIRINGAGIAYDTTSDYRLKENIEPLTDAVARLQALKPWRFNFTSHPDVTVDGFLAHEAQEVVPEAVGGEKDAVDDDGNPVYQGIDQSKLVPLLTAALQEAIGRIETLEAEVAALKAA